MSLFRAVGAASAFSHRIKSNCVKIWFVPATGRWHQTWLSSTPGRVEFDGGPAGGKMVLTGWWPHSGPKGEDGLTRMTYSRLEGNAVRQFGEFSADHGLTWQISFDLIYRPHKATP